MALPHAAAGERRMHAEAAARSAAMFGKGSQMPALGISYTDGGEEEPTGALLPLAPFFNLQLRRSA